jgi:hypothetical protein
LLGAIVDFFAIPFPVVPASIRDVISDEHLSAFRGGMGMAARDYAAQTGRPAATDAAVPAHYQRRVKRGRATKSDAQQPEGGLVFDGITCPPMFLADYWVSGDVDDIVPMHYVLNPERVVRSEALLALASWYPDQEVVQALAGGGVPSKDRFEPGVAVLGTNHSASIENYTFVDKMYATEMEAGRMSKYGIDQSPPSWPIKGSPTG